MKAKGIALLAAFAIIAALFALQTGGPAFAAPGAPLPTVKFTVKPKITLKPFLVAVQIPDPALDAALHAAAGVPPGDSIYPADLTGLDGTLNLNGKGIANAEGLQFCVNISALNLEQNSLSRLPDNFEKLTKLKKIILDKNKFELFPPSLLLMPNLTEIRLNNNTVAELPSAVNSITSLETLYIMNNRLEALPSTLKDLTKLKYLICTGNKLKKLPKELFAAPALEGVEASQNSLTELPVEIGSAPKLKSLVVQYNRLTRLPEGIGNGPTLTMLGVGFNSLTSVEPSLYKGNIQFLSLDGNRIRQLPDALKDKSFQLFRVEWNFIDVSSGAKDRAILDSLNVPANMLNYKNQLSPVTITSSQATVDEVKLKWKPLADGTVAGASWKVLKFEVYDSTASPAKLLATLDESVSGHEQAGLEAGKEYNLFVRVHYEITVGSMTSNTSCDTSHKITTEQAPAAVTETASAEPAATGQYTAVTAESTVTAETTMTAETATQSAVVSAAPEGEATIEPAVAASAAGSSGLLVVLIIVGSVIALALIALLIVLLVRKTKPQTIRK